MKYRFVNNETLKLLDLQGKKEEPLQNHCITFSFWKCKVKYQKLKNTPQTNKPGGKTIFTTLLNEIALDFTQSIKLGLYLLRLT